VANIQILSGLKPRSLSLSSCRWNFLNGSSNGFSPNGEDRLIGKVSSTAGPGPIIGAIL